MPRKKNEAASKTRISVLMQDWLYTYKRATIAPRTYESCARRVRLHVYPAFGDHFPGNISCEMVQKHINKLYDSGMALDSVKKVRQTMSQFFQYLVDNLKILTDNPVVKTKIHTKTRKDISEDEDDYIALPKEDRIRMIKALEEHQTLKPIVLSMMLAGMRIGEVLALKWRNVNLTDGILHIGEAVTVIPKVDEEGNVLSRRTTISNTKTCASVRSVPIPLNLTNALKEWKEIRTALQEKTGGQLCQSRFTGFQHGRRNASHLQWFAYHFESLSAEAWNGQAAHPFSHVSAHLRNDAV